MDESTGWPVCIFKNQQTIHLLKCCICNNIPKHALNCVSINAHVFCYSCIFDKNEAQNANEEKQQHTFNHQCPLQCTAVTLWANSITNLMINEQQVICIYSFKAQVQPLKNQPKNGDIENDVIITNQAPQNNENVEDIEGQLQPELPDDDAKYQKAGYCPWSGQLKSLPNHLKKCIFATQSCSFRCIGCIEKDIPKHKLLKHQSQCHIFHTELLLKELILTKQHNATLCLKLTESQHNNITLQNKMNALCTHLGVMFDEHNNITKIPKIEFKNEQNEENRYPNCSSTVYVIGYNKDYCQFGINSKNNLQVLTLLEWVKQIGDKIVDIHCGQANMAFITSSGALWCCGKNSSGELGMEIHSKSIIAPTLHPFFEKLGIPIRTLGNGCFTSQHCIVILQNGDVYAAGENKFGQLGIGNNKSISTEKSEELIINTIETSKNNNNNVEAKEFVSDFHKISFKFCTDEKDEIIDVSYGLAHTIFLTKHGGVYGCGMNDHGALGIDNNNDDDCTDISVPTLIDYFCKNEIIICHISCGRLHSVFVDTNGNVYSCGRNQYGQSGVKRNNNNSNKYRPQCIDWFSNNNIFIVKVSCGAWHCIALDVEGEIYSWGHGMNGALGIGKKKNENRYEPVSISNYNNEFKQIKCIDIGAGYYHSIVLTQNNKLYTFGYNGGYNSCIADINDYNNNNNNNIVNHPPKKFFKPHLVNLKNYFNNNDYLKQQYGKDLEHEPPVILKIFGGFYSSILMLKD